MNKGILLSGGMDSTAIAHLFKPNIAFNINYGQRPSKAERNSSRIVCADLNIPLVEIDIDCSTIGSGDLSNKPAINLAEASDWWPFRNQLLITIAAAKAIEYKCNELMIGTIAEDAYHTDGSKTFIALINDLVRYQEGNLSITAPAINLNCIDLLKQASLSIEQLSLAHSCHKSNIPCGNCRGCFKYQNAMKDLGYYEFA